MIQTLEEVFACLYAWVWGKPLLILFMGTALYLTWLLRAVQLRYLGYAIKESIRPSEAEQEGDISHFEALMTTLAGAIGTGSIVGVATAVTIGGLGSLFWMWVTAFAGMAIKYAESLLAVKYRVAHEDGEMVGGPMEYMSRGLGWHWGAILFAALGCLAAIGTGNLVQANSIADAMSTVWHIDPWVSGGAIAVVVGAVTLGGVKSVGRMAGIVVPLMAGFYLLGGLWILFNHASEVPGIFAAIFTEAFTGSAALGGAAGGAVMLAIQVGVARGVFTTEAGLGISSIAAAAARTDSPGRQAMIIMTGGLLSTVIICTFTGLVFGVTGVIGGVDAAGNPLEGAAMAIEAFTGSVLGGRYIVTVGLILFAYTTIVAFAYYGEKCCEFLFGRKSVWTYRLLYVLAVIPGAAVDMKVVWTMADTMNGLMMIPNLIALLALSKVLKSETLDFLKIADQEISERK